MSDRDIRGLDGRTLGPLRPRFKANISEFRYPDGTLALRDISIEIWPGECVGILGANGSGKTTLLKLLDGILKGYKGKVELDGTDIKELLPRQIYSKVGLVFQDPDDQLFASTVFEDVAFGPLNMGLDQEEVRKRVKEALRSVELEGFEDKRIQNLSYGQKKRVCIAGLLAMGQETLLMDEPLAGLDPLGEMRMLRLLKGLNTQKGVTMVIASHNVDMAPLMFDRVFILNRGHIECVGNPSEIFTDMQFMERMRLRLPYIGELFWRLKYQEMLPIRHLPITVEEGAKEIAKLWQEGQRKRI